MMGRTHSVHAEPTTFGLKCAGWAFEVARGRHRLAEATAEIATGKISGPVGTYSHLAPEIEAEVLAELGLRVDPVSTQIVQRDRHAAFLAAIAILGGSLERLATEVRNLQHTEIAEVMEPFQPGQKGSSAMPHKRNPILSERIAGPRPAAARLRPDRPREPAAVARARHQPQLRGAGRAARRHDPARLHAGPDDVAGRGPGRAAGADAREHRARPGPARVVAGAAGPRRARRAVARGRLRHRPAQRPAGRRRARAAPAAACRRTPSWPRSCRWPSSTPASTTPRCSATCPRSSPASTAWRSSVRLAEAFVRAGKVRDLYRVGDDRLLLVASDRLSAFDVVLPTPVPDKGRVLTGLSRYWFAETAAHRAQPPAVDRPGRRPGRDHGRRPRRGRDPARPDDARAPGRGAADRVRRPRLPLGLGLEGVPRRRRRVRDPAPGPAAGERPAAGPDLHAGHEGADGRARREHPVRERRDADRAGAGGARARRVARAVSPRRRGRASGRGSSSPTRSSSSGCCRPASCCSSTRC